MAQSAPSTTRSPGSAPTSTGTRQPARLLRARQDDTPTPVTRIELFFDLVFVFAVTQLTTSLAGNFTWMGGAHITVLIISVWWLWTSTAWATNLLDPAAAPVRALLITMMFGCLLLSACIPVAFGSRGLAFAIAFVSIQVGRTLFVLWAVRRDGQDDQHTSRTYRRILVQAIAAGVLWVAGGFADTDLRLPLWALAVGVEFLAPVSGWWVPGRGRVHVSTWDVDGGHLAERMGLFVIIALGESVLATGATFAALAQGTAVIVAFGSAFASSVAMWVIYFQTGTYWAEQTLERSRDVGRIARSAYTYFHVPIVAGIVVTAVSDELVLSHPVEHPSVPTIVSSLLGPGLFLLGTLGFKWATTTRTPWVHVAGIGGLLLLVPLAPLVTGLTLGIASTTVLIVVAGWEVLATTRADASGDIIE
ncbi:MAG TPA: low temperature requirement protein A [Thermomicrobiales bacterium]|jgi:low temperature requirement protein LtrA|nr:low temperature requirement protein A [Thermomicrobiales bacterium]